MESFENNVISSVCSGKYVGSLSGFETLGVRHAIAGCVGTEGTELGDSTDIRHQERCETIPHSLDLC